MRKLEPKFKKAFQEGLNNIADEISLRDIEEAIAMGNVSGASRMISELIVGRSFFTFQRLIQEAVQEGGDLAARWALKDGVNFQFNVTHSNTARFIRNYQYIKVQDFTDSLHRTVTQIIQDGVEAGVNPRQIANQLPKDIGLLPKHIKAAKNYRKMLESLDRDFLTRALRDGRYDRTVLRAISEGKPLSKEMIDKMVERYKERSLRWRRETIARTEALKLVNEGNIKFWENLMEDGEVREEQLVKTWVNTKDGRTREAHRTLPSKNPEYIPWGASFESSKGPIRYPHDPKAQPSNTINCRCTIYTTIIPD